MMKIQNAIAAQLRVVVMKDWMPRNELRALVKEVEFLSGVIKFS